METINKKNYCNLYIVRHGETSWNVEGRIQGQLNPSLTKNGVSQAKKAAKHLKKIKFAAVYSSDLARAKKTAEILALEHEIVVKTNHLLRERYYGILQGKKKDELTEELKKLLDLAYNASSSKNPDDPDDPERTHEIAARFITFLRELAVAYPRQNVLVVAHGGIMRAALDHFQFFNTKDLNSSVWINNLGYYVLESDGTDFFLKQTHNIKKTKGLPN